MASFGLLLVGVLAAITAHGFAQDKKACELLTRADVESVLGVTLEERVPCDA